MFADSQTPRLFGLPPGVDFPRAVVAGLTARLDGRRPEDWAAITIFVNTRRLQRRMREVFDQGPALLLPRLRLITDLAHDPSFADLPLPVAPLRRKLELAQLVGELIERQPDIAARSARFDLSDSLATLLAEMCGEGVTPETIAALDVSDQSGHWARTLAFIRIVEPWLRAGSEMPDIDTRQRLVIERLAARWATDPPVGPVIVAGSTGSRGATAMLIEAVARLPQGAVILPGYDFDMPHGVWNSLGDALSGEDHPQFRYGKLTTRLALDPTTVPKWHDEPPPCQARNQLVSLALRPAPVTDQWLRDGPRLGDLGRATQGLTLVEARSPRAEAEVIALRLRQAVADGVTAILITPDRMLTRQVEAALDRWGITPDDSAGTPLALSPPGRFLRQIAEAAGQRLTAEALLSLLEHPLAASVTGLRGPHLRHVHELELSIRKYGPPFPTGADLTAWATRKKASDPARLLWAEWVGGLIEALASGGEQSIADHLATHLDLAERIAAGAGGTGAGGLWDEAAGRKARGVCDDLSRHADAGGTLDPTDYANLIGNLIGVEEVRDRDTGHPGVLIRGTLEARVQSADLIILGGLNDGIWPPSPGADPWLNRALRHQAGLLLPERQIGLSAHDFQQGIAAPEVWLTRPIRSADAETVPSRWLNRLTNLLRGLPEQGGPDQVKAMLERGNDWLARSAALDRPQAIHPKEPACRPSPRPPVEARPQTLSVTDIGTLSRDPYAVYARRILGLNRLDPLSQTADAAQRGTILHKVFEAFIRHTPTLDAGARDRLMSTAQQVLDAQCPWPTVRHLWLGRIDRIADWFLTTEAERQRVGTPDRQEQKGELVIAGLGIRLRATADRIDRSPDNAAHIYDYKTGEPPTVKQQLAFDKQLLIEAAMLERGGFGDLGPLRVAGAAYIGLGANPKIVKAPLDDISPDRMWDDLLAFLAEWQAPSRGYSARSAPSRIRFEGDYDHLARRGEWSDSDGFCPEDLT